MWADNSQTQAGAQSSIMKPKETWAGRGLSLHLPPETLTPYWSSHTSCRKDESTGASRGQGPPLQPPSRPQSRHYLSHITFTSTSKSLRSDINLPHRSVLIPPISPLKVTNSLLQGKLPLCGQTVQFDGRAATHNTNNTASSVGIIDRRFKYIPHLDLREVRTGGRGQLKDKREKKRCFELISCESI